MPSEVQVPTEALHVSAVCPAPSLFSVSHSRAPGRCFNTNIRAQTHTSLSFTISSSSVFSQPHIFTKLVGAIIAVRPPAPHFGLAPISHQSFGKAHAQAKYHHSCLISLGNQTTNIQLLLFLCRANPKATIPKQQATIHQRADISAGCFFLQRLLSLGWRVTPRRAQSQLHNGTNAARTSAQAVFLIPILLL